MTFRRRHAHKWAMNGSQRISSLTPIGDVLARVAALARPVAPREMALADAEGRVLAEDAVVTAPWPAAPTALQDGWAVRADAVADAGPYAPMLFESGTRLGQCRRCDAARRGCGVAAGRSHRRRGACKRDGG